MSSSLIAQLLDTEDASEGKACGCEWEYVLSNALEALCKVAVRPEMDGVALDTAIECRAVLVAFREAQKNTRDR